MFVKLFSRLQNHFLKNCRACRSTSARGRHLFADPLFNFFRGLKAGIHDLFKLTVLIDTLFVHKIIILTTRSDTFISFYNTDSDLELSDAAVIVAVVIKRRKANREQYRLNPG